VLPNVESAGMFPVPPPLAPLHPRLVAGVRAPESPEGYYALAIPEAGAEGVTPTSPLAVTFFGVDKDGQILPGHWSYGQVAPQPPAYGHEPTPIPVVLAPDIAALEQSYRTVLCVGC
jgi:hypothetical protein